MIFITTTPMRFEQHKYYPLVPPVGDDDRLATAGKRILFSHSQEGLVFRVGQKGEVTSGWAIGVIIDEDYQHWNDILNRKN